MRRFILTAVTDPGSLAPDETLLERVRVLSETGVRRIVLRANGLSDDEYREMAVKFVGICKGECVIPVIAHHTDIAEEFDTELQLSVGELESDPSVTGKIDVCVSVHSVDEAMKAESLGASSITAGHIFDTDSKKGTPGRGIGFLNEIINSVKIPVYAIGGINLDKIEEINSTGASGICMMSTMMRCPVKHISKIVRTCFDINRPIFNKSCLALYAVTDSRWLRGGESIASKVEEAILGGATMVQLREKDTERNVILKDAKMCLRVCRSYGVTFIINDDVSLAKEVGADGVHLGQDDGDPEKARKEFKGIIGVSAHNTEEAEIAYEKGADYLGCGAVFSTSTKDDTEALGIVGLRRISLTTKLPIVAIGGIDEENISKLKGTGISGVAVVSSLFSKEDTRTAAKELLNAVLEIIER